MKHRMLCAVYFVLVLSSAPSSVSGQQLPAASPDARAEHVVLISVDGLRPEFYLDERWPAVHMRRMASEGVRAEAVYSVFPSVTYSAHTTMVTGALPARHGIFYNSPFEEGGQTGRWYWEAEKIAVLSLWDAVKAAGGSTAALWWPVTLGAEIDYNVPEIWPLDGGDWREMLRGHTNPAGYLTELERNASGPLDDSFRSAARSRADQLAAMAAYTLETHRPTLMLVHFVTTDSHQHSHGREHVEVELAVQAVDRGIGRIVEAAADAGILDRTTFLITGDHGFADIHTVVAPNVWLSAADLMEDREDRGRWRATFHTSGAAAFLHLRDPDDEDAVTRVREIIEALPDGTRALFRLHDRAELDRMGADPAAHLALSGLRGVSMSSARSGSALRAGSGGTHGHAPDLPGMETGFLAWGAGVRAGARIPEMGLQDVAPVVARLLGLDFQAPDGTLLPGIAGGGP